MRAFLILALMVAPAALMSAAHAEVPDAAAEAHLHYEKGQAFYDEGRYDEAITEYEAAYRLKPHHNVLYNIGQAYERTLDYASSVRWFERFLAEAPVEDGPRRKVVENRLKILRNLPARISITTIPEHVNATLIPLGPNADPTTAVRGKTPHLFRVPAGRYRVHLDHPNWESEDHEVEAQLGQPYFYQYRLKPSTSSLTVFTRPRGARVFIDDKLVGETPFADAVEVGRHRLLIEHPDYPWYRRDIEVRVGEPQTLEIRLTKPVRSGRTELVLASMLYGGAAGPLLVAALSKNSDFLQTSQGLAVLLVSSAAGIGAGFLGAFLTTREGIKVGHSSLIIGGAAWGTTLGASLALGLKLDTQAVYGLSLLGGAVGLTTAGLVVRWKDVMPGTAAILNSGALWGTAAGVLMAQSIFKSPSADQWGWFVFGGTSLGIVAGGILAWKLDRSRTHVFLVDIGGLVGTGLGFALGAAVGASSNGDIVQDGARYALGGMTLGILAAAALSRNFKGDLPPVEALLRRRTDGRWAFGIPRLDLAPVVTPEGVSTRLTATLLKGKW